MLKGSACGSWEDLKKLIPFQKTPGTVFVPPQKRLRQPGRPQRAYTISENPRNIVFAEGDSTCGSQEDLKKSKQCHLLGTRTCGSWDDLTRATPQQHLALAPRGGRGRSDPRRNHLTSGGSGGPARATEVLFKSNK